MMLVKKFTLICVYTYYRRKEVIGGNFKMLVPVYEVITIQEGSIDGTYSSRS